MDSLRTPQSFKVLGWDTSAREGYLFASEYFEGPSPDHVEAVLKYSSVLNVDQKQHSEGLLLGISEALDSLGWRPQDLSALGIGVGPGSFTGVRIGLTTGRTFGQLLRIPLIPVSSLELLERSCVSFGLADQRPLSGLFVFQDACMGELYCRFRSFDDSSKTVEWVTKIVQLEEDLRSKFLSPGARFGVVLPDSWSSHPGLADIFSKSTWDVIVRSSLKELPQALSILSFESWQQGLRKTALDVHPVYLRASDAELHLRSRENALRNLGLNG